MRRIIEVLTAAAPMAHKTRYLCASALTAVMLVIIAAPAGAQDYYGPYDYCVWSIYACGDYPSPASGAQGYSGLTDGPNGPYDYCVWSPYACLYY